MTHRAGWLLLFALLGLFAGILRGQYALALTSLAAFLWVLLNWLVFQYQLHFQLRLLKFKRRVNGREDARGVIWAGRVVHVELLAEGPMSMLQNLVVLDVVPEILELQTSDKAHLGVANSGTGNTPAKVKTFGKEEALGKEKTLVKGKDSLGLPNRWSQEMSAGSAASRRPPASCAYQLIARSAGHAELPGVRLTLRDSWRLFEVHRFLAVPQRFRILPDHYRSGELRSTVKRSNTLPRHGIHRLQREGAGSELLELREYAAGDPPKSIAWKVSARRNKLMTRKYESEVPVRVHLFIDGSQAARGGSYGLRLLDQLNCVAASVAAAAVAIGDPIGGMLIDETTIRRLPWMSGDRGLLEFAGALADFSMTPPPALPRLTDALIDDGLRVCYERYPELLDRRYLRVPFSVFLARRRRYRLVGVLAELYQLAPREQAACWYEDDLLAGWLQRLLWDAGMSWMAPIYRPDEDATAAGLLGMHQVCRAMTRAIAHARDNEVFVVLADLQTCAAHLEPFVRTAKLALAKHHRVAVVCPTSTLERPELSAANQVPIRPESDRLADLLLAAERSKTRDAALFIKRELLRIGATVSFSGERQAVHMVLAEMDLARDGKTRAAFSRAAVAR